MERVPVLAIESGPEALALRAASAVAERISHKSGRFGLCLSGGTTPRRAYELLGAPPLRDAIDWQRIHVFWGDERFVPPDHPDSNYRMACEALLEKVPIPAGQIHPVPVGAGSAEAAAALYEKELQGFYGSKILEPQRPLFDLLLLGLGEDGHIASLFPGTEALNERSAWVASVKGVKPEARITLTFPAIASSREILLLVSGAAKRNALARALAGDAELPAARLAALDTIRVFADQAAVGELKNSQAL
jgi:6-phosphogluconolactonase